MIKKLRFLNTYNTFYFFCFKLIFLGVFRYFNMLMLKIIFKKIKKYYFNIFPNKKYFEKQLNTLLDISHCFRDIFNMSNKNNKIIKT